MENLQANLSLIQQRLAAASDGKYPVPKLIAVTKTHPAEDILPLQNLGVTDIGENKVQEIMEKLPALEKNFRIHLIGRLQSNKMCIRDRSSAAPKSTGRPSSSAMSM